MKRKTASEVQTELERSISGRGWFVSTQNERQEAYGQDFAYRDVWTVEVRFNKEQAEIELPSELIELCNERGFEVTLDLSGWSERWSRTPDYRTRFILNDRDFDKIQYTEEEQERRELMKEISRNYDIDRPTVEKLADNFDSLDEILSASREELTEISGIGDTLASRILHRYSRKAKDRLEGRKTGIFVIPDKDGILRLPEEYEDGEHTPDYSTALGQKENAGE